MSFLWPSNVVPTDGTTEGTDAAEAHLITRLPFLRRSAGARRMLLTILFRWVVMMCTLS